MSKKGRILVLMLFSITGLCLWNSCTPVEVAHAPATVKSTFALRSSSAMGGKVTVEEAFLKLSHIDVSGNYQGRSHPTLTHRISPDDPPFTLSRADSSQTSFHLPSRLYDQLDFHLFLLQDDYALIIHENANDEDAGEENDSSDNTGNNNDDGGEPANGEGHQGEQNDDDHQDDDEENDKDNDQDKEGDGKGNDDDNDDDKDDDDKDDDDHKDDDDEKDNGDNDNKDDDDKGDDDKDDDDKDDDDKDDDDDEDDDDDGRSATTGRSVDIDHFFQNARPGLVIIGNYQSNNAVLKIIFVLDGVEKFTLRGRQNDSPLIRLARENTAEVTFNPAHWFTSITESMIESATKQSHQGQQIIFIHKNFNSNLYEALAPALEGSADLNITPDAGGL